MRDPLPWSLPLGRLFGYTAVSPAANVLLCLASVLLLAACGFIPSFNPIADPYSLPLTNWADNTTVASKDGQHLVKFLVVKDGDKKVSAEHVEPKEDGS